MDKFLKNCLKIFKHDTEDQLNPEFMTKKVIKPMKYGGCHPGSRTWRQKVIGMYLFTYCALMVILHGLNFAFDSNLNRGKFIDEIFKQFGYVQVGFKLYIVITKGDILLSMLNSLWNDFWSINRLDAKHKKSAISFYTLAKRMSDIYSVVCKLALTLLILQPLLKLDKRLIDEVWIPNKKILKISPYYEIVFAVQVVSSTSAAIVCLIPLDQLFIQLIFCVCVQFQILRQELKLLNRDDYSDKKSIIKSVANHHNTLIRFLNKFENVFSNMLLVTIATDYIIITMTMYGITYEEAINQKAAYFTTSLAMMGQIFAYCIAGQLVQDQSLLVGEAAYETDWFSVSNREIRKDIMNIITNSQREIRITAGGIMYLNMESFLKIVKTTYSLLTFLFKAQARDA